MRHNPVEVNIINSSVQGSALVFKSFKDHGKNVSQLVLTYSQLADLRRSSQELDQCDAVSVFELFLVHMPRLRHLGIHGTTEDPVILEYVEISRIPQTLALRLTSLDLTSCRFSSHEFQHLREFVNLTHLNLFDVKLFAPGVDTIEVFRSLQKLRYTSQPAFHTAMIFVLRKILL